MVTIDIEMPTDCASCWIRLNIGCRIANESGWFNNKRDKRCPLKEQEAVKPKLSMSSLWYECPVCNRHLTKNSDNYCARCGRPVLWEGR